MNTRQAQTREATPDEVPASVPQTTPASVGYGHPEYHFVQSIMEMQKTLGEINASILSLRQSVDSTKSKVDDLVGWKNKILGGAAVFGAICALLGFMFTKFSDYITISPPSKAPVASQTQAPLQQSLPVVPSAPQRQ